MALLERVSALIRANLNDLMAFVAERVAPYKKVRAVEVVDALPRSPSGKLLRRVLVERERAAQGMS